MSGVHLYVFEVDGAWHWCTGALRETVEHGCITHIYDARGKAHGSAAKATEAAIAYARRHGLAIEVLSGEAACEATAKRLGESVLRCRVFPPCRVLRRDGSLR